MTEIEEKKKLVIGWQVHRAYIDEGIDFVATRYWCENQL